MTSAFSIKQLTDAVDPQAITTLRTWLAERPIEDCPVHVIMGPSIATSVAELLRLRGLELEVLPLGVDTLTVAGLTDVRGTPVTCAFGPHRGPQGPNEDVASCPHCWSLSYALRPKDETYGHHLPDCSLPLRHESYCQPGGQGHPRAHVIRGYWPNSPQEEQ